MREIKSTPPIYLDNAATTRAHPEVARAVEAALVGRFANPSSRHRMGLQAEQIVRQARGDVARTLGAAPEQVTFTSGGTEANALALLGSLRGVRGTPHVLLSAIEHPSVRQSAALADRQGADVEPIPVTPGGWVEPAAVRARLRPETALVAVMHVNNETGVQQPVADIAGEVHRLAPRCRVLVDAVQSFHTLPIELEALGADLLTLSAHKIHGPKGVGCVVRRAGLQLTPLWGGGDQESGDRPGTENVPGIAGLRAAARLPAPDLQQLAAWTEALGEAVSRRRPDSYVVGDAERRAPHILALALPGVPTEVLINLLEARGLCISSGSACHSRRSLRSHVLDAMGVPRDHGVIRLSLGALTTAQEVERAAAILDQSLDQL